MGNTAEKYLNKERQEINWPCYGESTHCRAMELFCLENTLEITESNPLVWISLLSALSSVNSHGCGCCFPKHCLGTGLAAPLCAWLCSEAHRSKNPYFHKYRLSIASQKKKMKPKWPIIFEVTDLWGVWWWPKLGAEQWLQPHTARTNIIIFPML